MDENDSSYLDFLQFLNSTYDATDSTYEVNDIVKFCDKTDVLDFGATIIPVFYWINFILSFLGNGLVLTIIFKYEKLNTVTNIFLLNLVLSNFLFASSLPFWASYHMSEWIFGVAMCKLVSSAYLIGFYSSILFLTLMTFDRYLAVVHAVAAAKSRKKAYAISASVAVWCISILASVKELVLQNVWKSPLNGLICGETGFKKDIMDVWSLVTYYQQFLLFFLIPLIMVMYCYISITIRILSTRMAEKCRAIKLIFVIILTFFICWTPYNIVILLRAVHISVSRSSSSDCTYSDKLDYALYVTHNIAYLYCCISPVFYTFLGKKFQRHFLKLLGQRMPCLKSQISFSSQSTRSTTQRMPQSMDDF